MCTVRFVNLESAFEIRNGRFQKDSEISDVLFTILFGSVDNHFNYDTPLQMSDNSQRMLYAHCQVSHLLLLNL